ncbi:hypothetical protein PQC39_gp025 [Vibrio phage Vp_R1]|uniref:Uncharacterized protein n=1 Tax=Vibrio phage Vp_R1 TaxID=2059867 RepID=A0A2H5BPY5_9CAUD|nr:hypothetical protein PQC39_gp025 [Vibrio phage Vp_R1]AUG88389.1 hypothetical protein VPR_025 [Vibrio phage Vp_R1]
MDLNKILSISPDTLALEQHDALLKDTIRRLDRVKSLLTTHKYKELYEMCEFSPAGDCMGTDSYHINFHYGDIMDTAVKLQHLSEVGGIDCEKIPPLYHY